MQARQAGPVPLALQVEQAALATAVTVQVHAQPKGQVRLSYTRLAFMKVILLFFPLSKRVLWHVRLRKSIHDSFKPFTVDGIFTCQFLTCQYWGMHNAGHPQRQPNVAVVKTLTEKGNLCILT